MTNRHSLILYFLIAFGFTWSFHFSIKLLDLTFTFDIGNPAMMLYIIGIAGPLVSAVVIAASQGGMAGVKGLMAAGARWRFAWPWYLVALFAIPAINVINIMVFHEQVPADMGWLVVVPILIMGQLWVVIAEEFGWRGTALPALQSVFGSLGGTLILGPVWALWHLPMFFVEGSPQYSENVPAALTFYAIIVTFISIIFTMLYNRTGGSVLACMLFHASLNIAAFTIQVPADVNITIYLIILAGLISIRFLDRPLFGRTREPSG